MAKKLKYYNGSSWVVLGQLVPDPTNSDKDKYLHTNSSSGALEWSSISHLYQHNITVYYSGTVHVRFTLITTSATALTYSTLAAAINGAGHTTLATSLMASGTVNDSGTTTVIATGVYSQNNSSNLTIAYVTMVSTSGTTATIKTAPDTNAGKSLTLSNSYTVNDYVRTLQ